VNAPQAARILVVDDERLVAREIAENLVSLGYEVPATAATADEALEIACSTRPDLALLDIRIRGPRDGVETATALRARFGVPVIYLTACTDEATLARAKQTEPYAYLVKPIKPVELRSAVEIALRRSAAERRVREHGTWLEITLRSIADAVIATDCAGRITLMNPRAAALTGWDVAEAIGQPIDGVLQLSDENGKAAISSPIELALREQHTVELPAGTVLRRANGEELAIEDATAPIFDTSGDLVGAVIVFRDVSQSRKLVRQAELNERLAALGTLAAGVAHEVNNPLSFIIGNQQYALKELADLHARLAELPVLEREQLEGKVEEISAALSDAEVGADRVRKIVSELRKLSRPGMEKRKRMDPRAALESALAITWTELSSRATIVREYGQCPEILADETRLTQVFVNLLINAAHAIDSGEPSTNEVRASTGTDADGAAYVEVSDTGSGIPKSILPRIFEPFYTTRALETGTGLGLSISHGIVASLGGRIHVESQVGSGSTFRVTLPAAERAPSVPPARHSVAPREGEEYRLLIVDDERILLDSLTRALEDTYDVTTVTSGHEAVLLLERGESFDLVICDLMMPHMTGMEFFGVLESRFPELALRTVFMTGGVFTPAAQRFLAVRSRRVLAKPFTNGELIAFITESLVRAA